MERNAMTNNNEVTTEELNRLKAETEHAEKVAKLTKFVAVFVFGALVIALSMM